MKTKQQHSKKKNSTDRFISPNQVKKVSFFSTKIIKENFEQSTKETKPTTISKSYKQKKIKIKPTDEQSKELDLYEKMALYNPIPGWTDSITGELMKVPAISPDFSLLDFST